MQIVVPGTGRRYSDDDSLDWSAPLVFVLAEVMGASECQQMIERVEPMGFDAAPISLPDGFAMRPDIRNNERVMFDDTMLAAELFGRIREQLPARLFGRRPGGVNERFRCYLPLQPGQRFAPHYDGAFQRSPSECSELTLMIYLNDGFTGGRTAFHEFDAEVSPRTGMALLFEHRLLHEGCAVETGAKYVLRSDVMYGASAALPSRAPMP